MRAVFPNHQYAEEDRTDDGQACLPVAKQHIEYLHLP